MHIAGKVYDTLLDWHNDGLIDGMMLLQIDGHARSLMEIAGGCERIKNSPLAVSYRAFMRQGIALSLLLQPWYLANEFSVWCSLPVILISAYFLIGIELIAEDIEDPFGHDGDDHIPLDSICTNIKNTVGGIMKVRKDQKFTRSVEIVRPDLLNG